MRLTFEDDWCAPTSVEVVVPGYLGPDDPNTRFGNIRTHSRRG